MINKIPGLTFVSPFLPLFLPTKMKFTFIYLLLMISAIMYFGTSASLKKSTDIHCKSGFQSACDYIEQSNKLIEEL
tara:strand:+ start:1423 stop:1650 length:228 start_codon:yes stop_codon:yes gene_type:complete